MGEIIRKDHVLLEDGSSKWLWDDGSKILWYEGQIMALAIATVCNSIADLDVTGVRIIKDIDEIPNAIYVRELPLIFPKPDGFITDFLVTRDSFGGASALMTVTYTLHYLLLDSKVGSERGLMDTYSNFVDHAVAFWNALLGIGVLAGVEDIIAGDSINFGTVFTDPAGNQFNGAEFQINMKEFVN